jgi:hypothetical protein
MSRGLVRLFKLAVFALSACHAPVNPQISPQDPAAEISIRVVNRNRLDVMVYVVHDGARTRLGLATASATTDFTLSLNVLGAGKEYRLVGDPIGIRMNVTTETLHAQPGDEVTWSLEDSFARSTVVFR